VETRPRPRRSELEELEMADVPTDLQPRHTPVPSAVTRKETRSTGPKRKYDRSGRYSKRWKGVDLDISDFSGQTVIQALQKYAESLDIGLPTSEQRVMGPGVAKPTPFAGTTAQFTAKVCNLNYAVW